MPVRSSALDCTLARTLCDHRHLPDDEEDETSQDDPEGSRMRDTSIRDVQGRGEETQGGKNGDADLAEEAELVLPHSTLKPRAFRLTPAFSGTRLSARPLQALVRRFLP